MSETAQLSLPLILAEQAQKHVTHNEALRALDALVQLSAADRDRTAPPAVPADGDRHIVAAGATEEWAGHDDGIAAWQDGAWAIYRPKEGWRCWVAEEERLLVFDGAGWTEPVVSGELQEVALLGLGTTADASNPFAAKLNKALWSAKGSAEGGDGDLRYTMSKESVADVLSLLLQSGFSGRAEIGLVGDDDLTVKVSADGSNWVTAMTVAKDNGQVSVSGKLAVGAGGLFVDPANNYVFLGTAAARTNMGQINSSGGITPRLLAYSSSGPGASFAFIGDIESFSARPQFYLAKGRSAGGALAATDVIGDFGFNGSDGATYLTAAALRGCVDGVTPSAGSMAGRLEFWTNPGGNIPVERLRIDKDGRMVHRSNATTIVDADSHLALRSYTVATVPSAAEAARLIYVANGMANKRVAVSDGSAWRFADGTAVS